jgi:hypothetical protein
MRSDKENAKHLRLSGKSYAEISNILKIPRSTLSSWFSDKEWSKRIRTRLAISVQVSHTMRLMELNRTRGVHLERVYEDARLEACEELSVLKYNPLFIAGLMLYWGEGDKLTRAHVKITNTDPELIALFVHFLRFICLIPLDKIKGEVLIYPDLNEQACLSYWMKHSGLPKKGFFKTTTIKGKHVKRRLTYGVCMINVSSTYFKVKMMEWIKLLPKELMNREYYENIAPIADMV